MPAAPRAIIGDPLAQPVPLHRADCRLGVQDQARKLVTASTVISGLVPGQPGTPRSVAVLDVGRSAAGRTVGNLAPAVRARPSQRRVVVPAAGDLPDRVLGGGEQQLGAGLPGDPVDHPGQILIALDTAGSRHDIPPAPASPGGSRQPDQLLIRHLGLPAERPGKLGKRLIHSRRPGHHGIKDASTTMAARTISAVTKNLTGLPGRPSDPRSLRTQP